MNRIYFFVAEVRTGKQEHSPKDVSSPHTATLKSRQGRKAIAQRFNVGNAMIYKQRIPLGTKEPCTRSPASSSSAVDATIAYIRNQTEHHRTRTFREEFLSMLRRHGFEYDEGMLD